MWLAFWLTLTAIIIFALFILVWYFMLWELAESPDTGEVDKSILSSDIDKSLSPAAKKLIDMKDTDIKLHENDVTMISNGYPICHDGLCIYDGSKLQPHLRNHIPPRQVMENRKHKIPALLFQSFNHSVLHDDYYKPISHTLRLNTHYDYYFYDTLSSQKLIGDNFDPEVLQAYNDLIPGAYRCDLWRLCVLYVYGGIYMDLKLVPFISFDEMIDPNADIVLCPERFGIEYTTESLFNGFIACVPRHPLIKKYIDEVVKRVTERNYGKNAWDITGPRVFARVAIKELKCTWPIQTGDYEENGYVQGGTTRWYNDQSIYFGKKKAIKLRIPETGNKQRFAAMSMSESYNSLYAKKKVFRDRNDVRK